MKAAESERIYTGPSDLYRKKWEWDAVYWGTHCVDCYPGNCPMRVYVRGGQVWREEQSGSFQTIEPGGPPLHPNGGAKSGPRSPPPPCGRRETGSGKVSIPRHSTR